MAMPIATSLAKLPQKVSLSYKWADYIELICLVNPDGEISQADVLDRLKEGRGSGQVIEDDSESANADSAAHSVSESSDKNMRRVEDWFGHLEYRSAVCGDFYPFSLSEDGRVLQSLALTDEHYLYLFLLLAANLTYVGVRDRLSLAYDFELISQVALSSYMSPASHVYLFGKNPRNTGRYSGHVWSKINTLASDIGESPICSKNDFHPSDTGDEGVDLVAWAPLGDSAGALLVVLGQCACTEQWDEKQHTSHAIRWQNLIRFKARPISVVFIPLCFRKANGAWFRPHDITDSIVLDRVRLLYALQRVDHGTCCAMAKDDINGVFDVKESLV